MRSTRDIVRLGPCTRPTLEAFANASGVAELLTLRPLPTTVVLEVHSNELVSMLETLSARPMQAFDIFVLVDHVDETARCRALAHDIRCVSADISEQDLAEILQASVDRVKRRRTNEVLAPACLITQHAQFELRTLEEAESIATLLSLFCSEPERRVGGLLELLINAIEHGNLEISGPEKKALLAKGLWFQEISRRLNDERYASRRVRVSFERNDDGAVFTIEDDGAGFDSRDVLTRPIGATDSLHGRGIALARMMSFDVLRFEGRGNRAVGLVR
jgi:signal transduction histidine kinase